MHMKKKILLLSSVLLTLIIIVSIVFIINKNNANNLVLENKAEIKEQITGSNWLSMMYETGPGTGEYSESKSSLWPEDGYIFNDTLSGCENGGELSWNSETNTVNLLSNSSDACYVYFDAYIIPVINSVTTSNIETDSITLTVNVTNGNNPVTKYYYSNNNGSSYESSNSNTYTFNGLDMGTVYNFSVYVEDSAGYKSEVYTLSESTDEIVLLADWVINQYYGVQGNNGIYYHTSSLANSAGDNSYRYAGANPNNYVCSGSNASTCPSDNLYRIIGVFGNEVKLIKADYTTTAMTGTGGDYYGAYSYSTSNYQGSMSTGNIASYYWNRNGSNTWSESALNTTNLNGTYLNSLGSTWSNLIATHSWKVGGMTYSNGTSTPQTAYNYEVGSNSSSTTYSAKIGLMYVSDYGFAASPDNWGTALNNYSKVINDNWLYSGLMEWTIFRSSDDPYSAVCVYDSGVVNTSNVLGNYAVRPVFYLNSDVQYSSGSGTSSDPIRIVV